MIETIPLAREELALVDPVPEGFLPLVWQWLNEWSGQTLDDYSPSNLKQLIEKSRRDQAAGGRSYGITADGKPTGAIWFEAMGDGMFAGHLVFPREGLSPKGKLQSVKMTLDNLFASGGRKVLWPHFADNRAFHIFLRRLGATEEGLLKQQTRRRGELADVRVMASFASQNRGD